MELVHLVLNIVIPSVIFVAILVGYAPYFIFKCIYSIIKSFLLEDMSGKVVIITGASSGIGEHIAYEYAKKGARLALVARREKELEQVAEKARVFGSPDVIHVCGDVTKPDDCSRFVEKTVNHFGRLDHLVNNAGIMSSFYFEEATNITNCLPVMDVNFWGSIYPTQYALPHLKKTKGRIVINASVAGWMYSPSLSFYGASKAAVINFYDTLRLELGSSVAITIAIPGFVDSDMTQGKILNKKGEIEKNTENKEHMNAVIGILPVRGVKDCAKTIVHGVCKGDRYVTDPFWFKILNVSKLIAPDIVEWFYKMIYVNAPTATEKNALQKTSHVNGITKIP